MTYAETVARKMGEQGSSRAETAVLVRMDGRFAVVNIGTSTVTIPCVGFYPPLAGMPVRVDWVNGSPAVTGPVHPLNPLGRIVGTGTPRATVRVDGVDYTLPYRDGYTPSVDDDVEVNWVSGVIQGRITAVDKPVAPPESGGGSTPFDVTIRAADSGRYQPGSGWWGNDPWASSNNQGIWTYSTRISDAVAGGSVSSCAIFLPLISEVGLASIGVHDHPGIPGGAPSISSLVPLRSRGRAGWVSLPFTFGVYVASGNRGIGVVAPGGGGYTRWRGTASDSLSGAIRITGTR